MTDLILELGRLLRAAESEYTHCIFVMPLGRLSPDARKALALFTEIYPADLINSLIIFVSHCDGGETTQHFRDLNASDEDLGPLLRRMEAGLHDHIVVGSLLSSPSNPARDVRNHLPDRGEVLAKIGALVEQNWDGLAPKPVGFAEILRAVIYRVAKAFGWVSNSWKDAASFAKAFVGTQSRAFEIRNHYPRCSICMAEGYSDSHDEQDHNNSPAMFTKCQHIFHLGCLVDSVAHQRLCPLCRQSDTSCEVLRVSSYRSLQGHA